MEEKQIQTEESVVQNYEPVMTDNFDSETAENYSTTEFLEGQSQDPSELILGKFKSVDDLSKAYLELQKHQGESSQELGNLRKNAQSVSNLTEALAKAITMQEQFDEMIRVDRERYNQPEYFQDSAFRQIYREAFMALGDNLDTDKFVNLLEGYVKSRLSAYEKGKSAEAETQNLIDGMGYSKSAKNTITTPKKSLDEMTSQEVDELLDRLL